MQGRQRSSHFCKYLVHIMIDSSWRCERKCKIIVEPERYCKSCPEFKKRTGHGGAMVRVSR